MKEKRRKNRNSKEWTDLQNFEVEVRASKTKKRTDKP
jgi:hypothetical protein